MPFRGGGPGFFGPSEGRDGKLAIGDRDADTYEYRDAEMQTQPMATANAAGDGGGILGSQEGAGESRRAGTGREA